MFFLSFEIATLFLFDYSISNLFCWALFKKKKFNFYLPLFTSAFSGVGMSPSAWCEAWKPAAARWCFWRTCWMKLEPGCCTTWASQKVKRSGGDKRARFLARILLCETRAPVTWIFWSFFSNEGPGRPGGHSGDGGSQCTDRPGEPAFSSRVF